MMITIDQLNCVRSELHLLTFNPHQDGYKLSLDERSYIEHYQLDIATSQEDVQHFFGFFHSNGFDLATHYWLPKNPCGTYFIVHGYFDHVGLYGHLIRHLLQLGYAVVAFDLPGHGLSSGEPVSIESFDYYVAVFLDLLKRCQANFPKPWKAVGQSTGGAVLVKYILAAKPYHYNNELQQVTILAPLIRPRGWLVSRYTYLVLHRVLKRITRKIHQNSADPVFNQFLASKDPLQARYIPIKWIAAMKRWTEEFTALPPSDFPLKVLQGNCDSTVDWKYNLGVLANKFSHLESHLIQGAQHHMVNEVVWIRALIFQEID